MTTEEVYTPSFNSREQMQKNDCWDVEQLYSSWEVWEEQMQLFAREKQTLHWPEIAIFESSWQKNPEQLKSLIETCMELERQLSKLYTYAHLRHDEDVAEEVAKIAMSRISTILYAFRQETAWVEPALLRAPEKALDAFITDPVLASYRLYLERIVRLKSHTLSQEQEELMALVGKSLETSSQAFGAFNNADLKFPDICDSKENKHALTHGKYLTLLKEKDRTLRENAFKTLHRGFLSYENTLSELLQGQIQKHVFERKARKYSSCLEAALYVNEIDPQVYFSLIQSVHEHLPSLHRYISLRKKYLKVSSLHAYDLFVPLVKDVEMDVDYDTAVEWIVASLAPLGVDYQETVKRGLTHEHWVDRYETPRKRSGAYSSGCYDSMPYILMNYQGTFNDMMTLTHEVGHSMHSYFSRLNQPYQYSQYGIFVAEVASTFHEELLFRYLFNQAQTKEQKAFLINQKLDAIRSTLIRQTMFAEFELYMHEKVDSSQVLTPAVLKNQYRKLNEEYFGKDFSLDAELDVECLRIPHFYYNFYVYQYATGISAAHALAEKVCSEETFAQEKYLRFLSAGSSKNPLDLLKEAGVDMRSTESVKIVMRSFDQLVTQLEKFLEAP
ncbi:Oligoendopeptidase F [Candidatus Rhabdochlamydia oedothoracis]|uniref:Oligopeptidase F n=1 Tax=Candidatus Rhabdochlamydia oedothoracis TaxID=2720720 RepID=A0ABX8V5Q1_9BACT|nr:MULTISPECIES: oligoendopeptidase F [Rhabdochlamydia]KAG6559657.1 Oligoendopeptidase F, plasmid [Candidatus Rhabdochlamydia sp. W815]QYF48549.1 Oligoendopeptidase F [Candidatus Rhabdochlamydia oedothoracis]